ncbi:MAG: efflux RND transporter periplasmic adaptor subunit, partial [Pseudomonadota bacterium]
EVALVTGETRPAGVSFNASTADDDTRTIRIELTVDNEDQAIKSGLTSRISVKLPPTQAHYVKPSALTLADDGTVGVRVAVDDSARFLPVTILGGDRDGIWLGGLPDQIDLIVVGQEYVTDGTALDITRVELGAGS